MSTISEIPATIAAKLAELDREREKILASVPFVLLAESVAAQFPDLPSFVAVPNAGRACHYVTINKSMREVIAVLRAYRRHGLKVERFDDHEHARVYHLSGNVDLYATVPTEGASCRFVQVGVREVPVMELRCEN